jgi:hypothetical protein
MQFSAVLNNAGQFVKFNVTNVDPEQNAITISAVGNVQCILGLYTNVEMQANETHALSDDNSMRIQYIKV